MDPSDNAKISLLSQVTLSLAGHDIALRNCLKEQILAYSL